MSLKDTYEMMFLQKRSSNPFSLIQRSSRAIPNWKLRLSRLRFILVAGLAQPCLNNSIRLPCDFTLVNVFIMTL